MFLDGLFSIMIGQTHHVTSSYSAHMPWSTGLLVKYDYQPELGKLCLFSGLTHLVFFGGLLFLQYLQYLLIVHTRV
jgi:hypothetical protein